ncbi:DUF2470 domain-containing protein [Kutzneria albida]|uniref:DUF2470 domain-containing protein n=1 Tax=Kutzneria albida DSM 43870 TaxID=1449976 RepID=W5VYG9_9PSEU|nr:DUF2470 domain-containing protein [Kutzneria albida]AHH93490.1 hypothetical protein KALB_113 [Kutzneria albida DSM 43870]
MTQATRRPQAPNSAERARTIAARGGKAALVPSPGPELGHCSSAEAEAERVSPLLHHVHADGSATLLLDDDHPLVSATWQAPRGELTAMLELTDAAPVPLREPVRGLLWITGWLRALTGEEARAAVLEVVERRPDPRLLDAGHGATVLRLTPASMVVADAEGTSSIRPSEFSEAEPDPFAHYEDGWLRHLELSHRDVVELLCRHLPDHLRGGHVRPLGLDRFGLRLRVEAVEGDHDVRIAFAHPVTTPKELAAELRRLLGCPFMAQVHYG